MYIYACIRWRPKGGTCVTAGWQDLKCTQSPFGACLQVCRLTSVWLILLSHSPKAWCCLFKTRLALLVFSSMSEGKEKGRREGDRGGRRGEERRGEERRGREVRVGEEGCNVQVVGVPEHMLWGLRAHSCVCLTPICCSFSTYHSPFPLVVSRLSTADGSPSFSISFTVLSSCRLLESPNKAGAKFHPQSWEARGTSGKEGFQRCLESLKQVSTGRDWASTEQPQLREPWRVHWGATCQPVSNNAACPDAAVAGSRPAHCRATFACNACSSQQTEQSSPFDSRALVSQPFVACSGLVPAMS